MCLESGGFAGWFWLRGSPEGGLQLLSCSQGSPSVEVLAPKALAPGPVASPWTCDCCHVLLVTQISSNTMQKGSICYSFSFGKSERETPRWSLECESQLTELAVKGKGLRIRCCPGPEVLECLGYPQCTGLFYFFIPSSLTSQCDAGCRV